MTNTRVKAIPWLLLILILNGPYDRIIMEEYENGTRHKRLQDYPNALNWTPLVGVHEIA